ncbi:hypothetical protein Leryth_019491 [Lithospermum erythrorhizon]|nr:hypothetical protein Leryth_019491 [Lithospermum erythrorhizon]
MDAYNIPQYGHADAYMIQSTELNQHLSLLPEQFQAMYSEGNPEFFFDQGMLYPTANSYGYFCTGYEPPVEWDDHQRVFGLDGQEMQYVGAQTDSLPFVYYTPNYGYTQSLYNPYNPYIPGAMIGVDNPFLGSQQYYSVPAYDSASSAYVPMMVQSMSDDPNSSTVSLAHSSASTVNRSGTLGLKHNMPSTSTNFNSSAIRPASSRTTLFQWSSEGKRSSAGSTKQPTMHGGVTLGSFSHVQGRSAQSAQNVTYGKTLSSRDQLKTGLSTSNGLTSFASNSPSSKLIYKGIADDQKAKHDVLVEHNKHLRTPKSRRQLVVEAYNRKAGNVDEKGNILIDTEQYNRDDFLLDFQKAKFFIIKSYSEDDVHKSIKYNVWSSTPNGNKKLHGAYDDAQRIAAGAVRGCPIFLFFSVNASGQFCGVAEMTGPVDFCKDMDFWQQDKWSGSFPVKWHIIKDVPNPTFRHIILETNENKPVTNSRDTQEIPFEKGLEMLKIFKTHASRTSLLDDFMYYENRQRILQEQKARFLTKSYGSQYIVPVLDPPRKIAMSNMPSARSEYIVKRNDSDNSKKFVSAAVGHVSSDVTNIDDKSTKAEAKEVTSIDSLRIGELDIGPKMSQGEKLGALTYVAISNASPVSSTSSASVVTVGSVPIKVNSSTESSGFLTVGTIPLDPRALTHNQFKNDT